MQWLFSKCILLTKQYKAVFLSRDILILTKNTSNEQIYASLDDVERADKDDIDNLLNDSDTEFIAEEEIKQAASTQDTSLTTPEANLHVVPSDNQSKKKEKNKKEELWKWTKKVKVTKQEECHLVPEIQPNLNETVSPIEIFSLGDRP